MKKRILLTFLAVSIFICIFATSVCAAELIKSSSDEFGEVNVVEGLTSASSDRTSKVVLKNADNTYSTFYTHYIFPSLNWRKGMTGANFTQLNEALGTSYALNSVIRLEILSDCEYHELDSGIYENLREIHFPADSKITQIRRYYSYVGVLEKINIPPSVTALDQNAFRDCTGLKYVTFDEGCTLTTITKEAFRGCTSLEEICLPDSVTSVGGYAFGGCTSLTTIRYGANLQTFESRATTNTTVFYISSVTMKDFTGKMDNNYFGDTYTPKVATIFYTGTYDEALAFKAKSTHKDAWNGTGGLANARLVEWDGQNSDSYYISDTEWTIVYGYNKCLAFYGGEHLESEVTYAFEGEKYLSSYYGFSGCSRCQSGTKEEVCGALFVNKGYAKALDGSSFTYGISINREEIAKYEKFTGETVSYGIFAAKSDVSSDGALIGENNAPLDGVILADFTENDYSLFDLRVNGISEENKATEIYCGAYAIIGNATIYLGEGVSDTAKLISSDLIKNIEN